MTRSPNKIPLRSSRKRARKGVLPGAPEVPLRTFREAEQKLTAAIRCVLAAQRALDQIGRVLHHMYELVQRASQSDLGIPARASLHHAFIGLCKEIDAIAMACDEVGDGVLDGRLALGVTYTLRMGGEMDHSVSLALPDCRAAALGLTSDTGLDSVEAAEGAATSVSQAASSLQTFRCELTLTRARLVEMLDLLTRPTLESLVQLHKGAIEHLRVGAALMEQDQPEAATLELDLVRSILDLITNFTRAISPDLCGNLERLFAQLDERLQLASEGHPGELGTIEQVLVEMLHTWQVQVDWPLKVSQRHLSVSSPTAAEVNTRNAEFGVRGG